MDARDRAITVAQEKGVVQILDARLEIEDKERARAIDGWLACK